LGSARIHGELLKLGFEVSDRTVSRWVKRASKNPDPAQLWLAFLRNHRQAIAAMDFFTVPTLTFGESPSLSNLRRSPGGNRIGNLIPTSPIAGRNFPHDSAQI
jgi:hypothetical protein